MSELHDEIAREYAEHGFVTRWLVVAEVATLDDNRQLHVAAGNGAGEAPPTWDLIGMLDHATMMIRYDDSDED